MGKERSIGCGIGPRLEMAFVRGLPPNLEDLSLGRKLLG